MFVLCGLFSLFCCEGLTYNVLGAGAAGVGAQIQNIQIDGQEAIFIPAALTGGATHQVAQAAGQIVRPAGGSPQTATATAYQNVTIRNGTYVFQYLAHRDDLGDQIEHYYYFVGHDL